MPASPMTSPFTPDLRELRAWMERMVQSLRFVEMVAAVVTFIGRMVQINAELTKRVNELCRKRPPSERLKILERQLALPLGALSEKAEPPARRGPKSTASRRGRHPGRAELPAHLTRIETPNPVPADLRLCPLCGRLMTTVDHARCERLSVIPARVVVEVRLDERVACPQDDTIVTAPTPPAIVERGKLTDTFIVEATCEKYLEHQPVERQCTRLSREGVELAPQTLGRSINAHLDLLHPLAKAIHDQTRSAGVLGTDATGLLVLDPEAREHIRTAAMWCWTNARWVSFAFTPSADSASIRRFLGDDLARTVQCDGTNTLTFIEKAGGRRPGCWSHGRRRFAEAARGGDLLALEGLRRIVPLFLIERASALAGETAPLRQARRQRDSQPILDDIRSWLDDLRPKVIPKTPLGRALGYLHRQWKRLVLFVQDGNIELTNNRRERELRRLVLGRKNWLFTWLDVGGERTADILTIVATCIAHDINPRAYLHRVTTLIVEGWPDQRRRELLPDRIAALFPELDLDTTSANPA
jgi:transposase